MKKLILSITLGALTLVSCKKEKIEETQTNSNNLTLVQTTTDSDNNSISLYIDTDQLYTGHNKLYFDIQDESGNEIGNSATVTIQPIMDMTTMSHSAPTVQPVYSTTSGTHASEVIFQMGSMGGTWTINITINGTTSSMSITVAESATKVVGVYTGTDSKQYIIALKRPIDWSVGMNDLDVYLYERETMMSFLPVTDMSITMTPEMPSMGHGSPNNVSPTHTSNGIYSGQVNYTMTGDWRLHFLLEKNSTEIHADAFLDILF